MPLLAGVVVGSLAIGIGVNTTVFSWIQGLVLSPLPGVKDGAGFRSLESRGESGSYPGISWMEYQDLRTSLRSFPELIAALRRFKAKKYLLDGEIVIRSGSRFSFDDLLQRITLLKAA